MTRLRSSPMRVLKVDEETSFAGMSRAMTAEGVPVPADAGLRQLCMTLRGELRRFLLARRVAEMDADDLLQDLFLRLETTVTGPIRSPRAYLYQMLNNMAHTRRRTETRQQARDAGWLHLGGDRSADRGARRGNGDEDIADSAANPEASLLARDHLTRVNERLDRLPERTAYVFRQYRIEGVSQKDIALDLGISLSAVEKHLQRAYHAVLEIRNELDPAVVERTPNVARPETSQAATAAAKRKGGNDAGII